MINRLMKTTAIKCSTIYVTGCHRRMTTHLVKQ